MLLCQVSPALPNVPYPPPYQPGQPSGDFWNPANWGPFVAAIGLPGFFAVILFGFFVWFLWRNLNRWDRYLVTLTAILKCAYSPGGVGNVSDFRDAGHDLMNILQDIGDGISEDVGSNIKPKLDKMRDRLRNVPPPIPALYTNNSDPQ